MVYKISCFMWCQQTPLLGKHKLRSQALIDEIRQPPKIHNIGTYPPPNGHPGSDTTHRLTYSCPQLCQPSRSRTRQPTYQKTISSRSPLAEITDMRSAKIVEQKPLRRGRTLTTHPYTDRFKRPHVDHKTD